MQTKCYNEGMQAYKNGKEMWECPYAYLGSMSVFNHWIAGWMAAKQLDQPSK
jgi:ribosome modulation factor